MCHLSFRSKLYRSSHSYPIVLTTVEFIQTQTIRCPMKGVATSVKYYQQRHELLKQVRLTSYETNGGSTTHIWRRNDTMARNAIFC